MAKSNSSKTNVAAAPRKSSLPTTASMRRYLTIVMGCFIPALSYFLSLSAGTMIVEGGATNYTLAGFAFVLMAAVLGVSLPHLASAIRDITHSGPRLSWLLAVAFDLTLVFCELAHSLSTAHSIGWVLVAFMVATSVLSAGLNCWAFFHHEERPAVRAKRKADTLAQTAS
jgi:hypothetical protein